MCAIGWVCHQNALDLSCSSPCPPHTSSQTQTLLRRLVTGLNLKAGGGEQAFGTGMGVLYLQGPVRTSQTQGPSGPWPSSQGMETVPGSGAPRGWGEPRLLPSEEPGAAPQLRTFSGKEAQGFCSTEGLNKGGTWHFGRTFQKLTGYRQGEVVKEPS